jgi:transcriptional regulator with XRE-family HTH domain
VSDDPFRARFREARKRKKLTQSVVAELLDVSQSAVAQWESGRSYPSETMAGRIKQLLGIEYQATERKIITRDDTRPRLPVIGSTVPGDDECIVIDDVSHGEVLAPPQLEDVKGAKAVYVRGHAMEPRYFAGEVVYLHPKRPPNPGDFVFVTVREPGFQTKVGYIRQYIGEDLVSITLSTLNPRKKEIIQRPNLVEMATIVGSGLF